MVRSRRWLAAATLALGLLTASTVTTEVEPVSATDGPTLVLLDPGAEPRTELRYRPTAGCVEVATIADTTLFETKIDFEPFPVGPAIGTVIVMESTTRLIDRGFARDVLITDARVAEDSPPSIGDGGGDVLGDLRGATFTVEIDELGNVLATSGLDDVALGESAHFFVKEPSIPLPRDPVGVGARWITRSSLPLPLVGLDVTQDRMTTIEWIDGDEVGTSFVATQSVGPDASYRYLYIEAHILEWEAESSGTQVINLRHLNPTSALGSIETSHVIDYGSSWVIGVLEQEMVVTTDSSATPGSGCAGSGTTSP